MNKIKNWTFGALFRTLGRFLGYIIIGLLIALVSTKLGLIMSVNAETVSTSGTQFNVYVDSNVSNGCSSGEGQGYKNLDTSVNLTSYQGSVSSTYAVSRVDYYTTVNLNAGTTYTLEIMQSFNPKNWDSFHASAWDYYFEGSTTNSTSGLNANNVDSYYCYIENINNAYQVKLHCTFSPKVNLKMLYWRTWTNCNATGVSYFNTYTLKIDSVSGVEESINNQTNIINNQTTKIEEQTESINDIKDLLEDNSDVDASRFANLGGYLDPGPLDGILALPLSIINNLNTKLHGTCSPIVINLPYVNRDLTIPCISTIFGNINGLNTALEAFGYVASGFILYNYLVYLYNWVDDITSLKHSRPRLFGANSDADNWGGVVD